jgi:NADH dehydrogenase [ubiquinone] 1 alpha subcomplex assembly factor 7
MCRQAAEKKGAAVMPLVSQGVFLVNLGILDRVQQLITKHPEKEDYVVETMRKLIDPKEMGAKFKVMGIVHPSLKEKVVGFEENSFTISDN